MPLTCFVNCITRFYLQARATLLSCRSGGPLISGKYEFENYKGKLGRIRGFEREVFFCLIIFHHMMWIFILFCLSYLKK